MKILKFTIVSFLTILSTIGYSQTGVIACYTFDGDANNSASANHNGTVNGATLTSDRFGNMNSAYSFDGTDDFIQIPHSDDLNFDVNDDFSISLWLKPATNQTDASAQVNEVMIKWDDFNNNSNENYPYGLRIYNQNSVLPNSNGQLSALRWDNACNNASIGDVNVLINDGNYHHIVYIKSGNNLKLYIDNQLNVSFTDNSVCSTTSTDDLYIGKKGGTHAVKHFTGEVDDVVIYDYALSDSLINCLFNTTSVPCSCNKLPTAIEESKSFDPISVSFNHNSSVLSAEINNIASDVSSTIFDVSGKLVSNSNFDGKSNLELDLSDLSSGIYFVRIQAGEYSKVEKISITK